MSGLRPEDGADALDGADADDDVRRLEARIVAGDQALRRQGEALLAAAANRAERAAVWGIVAAVAAAALLVLGLWNARRGASRD